MLSEISIKNVAVIEKLNIALDSGMTVLTGETGAGKSIIIDSINLILGDRTNKGLVRYGEKKAQVQAIFETDEAMCRSLEEEGFDCEDGQVIITREVTAEGKSTARINGMAVTLAQLRELSPALINIHGQHDNQALLTPAKHVFFLDCFAENEQLRSQYKEAYLAVREIEKKQKALQTDESERMRRMDLLTYQIEEIRAAALEPGEDEELSAQRDEVANAEKIAVATARAFDHLYGGGEVQSAYDGISIAVDALEDVKEYSPVAARICEAVSQLNYVIEDAAHELKDYGDSVEYDPAILNDIEERLDLIRQLKRKYGGTIEAVLEFQKKAQAELAEIESADEQLEKLEEDLKEAKAVLEACAAALSENRRAAAQKLQRLIEQSLWELDMEKASFQVLTEPAEYTAEGADKVEFLITTNPGEPLKPLVKVASGGELSRVMLAMKSVLADSDGVYTMIFDEIDTGVSGNAAQKIARKLAAIGKNKQVICITHLPQLASMADHHFLIKKRIKDDRTATTVALLTQEERERELARITDGDLTEVSLKHAREMLKKAEEYKCSRSEL